MPHAELGIICKDRNLSGCVTIRDGGHIINLQGPRSTHTMLMNIQFMSWKDIGRKCGIFKSPACHDATTLYLYEYNLSDDYKMGAVGDNLAEMMNIDLGLNYHVLLGRNLYHTIGYPTPWVFPWDVNIGF